MHPSISRFRAHLLDRPASSDLPRAPRRAHYRAAFLRAASVTGLSSAVGIMLLCVLLPILRHETITSVLLAHIGASASPVDVFLRLCLAYLPAYLLLAAAGLTRFSGGLCTLVLGWRGLCDGAAFALLLSVVTGNTPLADTILDTPVLLFVGFSVRMLMDAAARTLLAADAKRLAADPQLNAPPTDESRAYLRYRLWTYLACLLVTLTSSTLTAALYVLLLRL